MINVTREFLSKEECKKLIEIIENQELIPSPLAKDNRNIQNIRTSTTSSLKWTNPDIYKLFLKIANHLSLPPERGEKLQGQKYLPGQFFKPHVDAFREPMYDRIKASGNRVHTLMIYLNDDMEGGQTNFPLLDKSFKPEIGMALDWPNMENGVILENSLHEGSEIKKGTKYIITSWWRENKYQPKKDKELES